MACNEALGPMLKYSSPTKCKTPSLILFILKLSISTWNGTGNDYDSESASQMNILLMLPVFLSSLTHDIRTDHNKRQSHDSAFDKTLFLSFTSIKVRKQQRPHLTVCLAKDYDWSTLWVRNSGWMFFANWTSKPQVCLSDPSFNHASGLPTENEKQAASAERKSRFAAPACKCIHCSWWESRYNVQGLPLTCFRAISWDPSRYCGVTQIQSKSLQESSESLQKIRQQNEEREYFLHLKKERAAQTGTRDVGDTIVVSTTVGTIKSH